MKQILILFLFFLTTVQAQELTGSDYVREHYKKAVYDIPMRDGIKLHTIVYTPKNKKKKYPILMKRTCYNISPYGENDYPPSLGPSPYLMEAGYIFVYQDVRGRYMSEGSFDNMRPHVSGNDPKNTDTRAVDESSDTYDTIDWLIKNIKRNNGRVGQWGISYPGFYTAAALPEAHPALKASSPQAPISDFYFDDFHHNGALLQSYLMAYPVFGLHKEGKTTRAWYSHGWNKIRNLGYSQNDAYDFHLKLGPIKNVSELYADNFFWNQMVEHPNYDEFWQKRSILPHLKEVDHAVMTVGGWFDAEDLYGPLNIYKNLEKNNPNMNNTIVMGPWSHGDWAREKGVQKVNHIYFGDSISTFYQKEIEFPFFEYYLKDEGENKLPEAYMFDTGIKEWNTFDIWPPKQEKTVLRFASNGLLTINEDVKQDTEFTYYSDPNKPVPYRSEVVPVGFTPRAFMTDDQRHASRRPDVLTFQTEVLTEDWAMAGEIMAKLEVMLGCTDADFIVKVIDVYPDNAKRDKGTPEYLSMGGYQQLVRSEVFRGRFRNSFEKPEAFTPNEPESVHFRLQDVLHTFKKGHRVMIQIHSTWFPYIDRNPQNYIENIFEADEDMYTPALITVLGSSSVEVN